MDNEPKFEMRDGQLYELVTQSVPVADESQLENEATNRQTDYNDAVGRREQAEQVYSNAEAAAEAASNELESAKHQEEESHQELLKSQARMAAARDAHERAANEPAEDEASGDGEDAGDDEEPADSEAVEIPVAVG